MFTVFNRCERHTFLSGRKALLFSLHNLMSQAMKWGKTLLSRERHGQKNIQAGKNLPSPTMTKLQL